MNNKINIISLGCAKNLVDSEKISFQLAEYGWQVEHSAEKSNAETIIVNTCGFIGSAKEESVNTILQAVELKKQGVAKAIYVCGCLSQLYPKELAEEIKEVDGFFGKFDAEKLINTLQKDKTPIRYDDTRRLLATPSHYAYLKISEGCNRTCSFCAIPSIVGKHKSVSIEKLVAEATQLAKQGVKELIIVAQDVSYYGVDLYKKRCLTDLLKALCQIDDIQWIKLHYAYPQGFPFDVLPLMREEQKICAYLDIPLQHISNKLLTSMRRQTTRQETVDLIHKIRQEVPGIHLRTTMIVGYPDETEEDFQALIDFIKEARFERMGAFPYSHESNTYAEKHYVDTIPEEVKQERLAILMKTQQDVSTQICHGKIRQTLRCIIDEKENGQYIGRTEFDSPEVDGIVWIASEKNLKIGDFYQVTMTDADGFDLFGKVVS